MVATGDARVLRYRANSKDRINGGIEESDRRQSFSPFLGELARAFFQAVNLLPGRPGEFAELGLA